jgi:predicted PurR-regulated permease PerM
MILIIRGKKVTFKAGGIATQYLMLKKHPLYLKATVILAGLVIIVYILSTLQDILIPLAFGLLLAILLNPLVALLNKRMSRGVAIIIVLSISLIIITGVGYMLVTQIASFSDALPLLKVRLEDLTNNIQHWIRNEFGINLAKQGQFVTEAGNGMKPYIGSTLGAFTASLATLVLLPVYTFLFLFYKTLLLNFLYEIFDEENSAEVATILTQTKQAIQGYMFGLLLEALIMATLNSIALLILGVDYAILIGVLGAMINILPYIGGIVSIALPLLMATITKQGFHTQIGILVTYIVIQFVDNHFLIPYIVSSKVKINALISIVIVLMGGALWGVSGMFLAIPFIGILKLIFDRVPTLQPWGKLLGDERMRRHKGEIWNNMKPKRLLSGLLSDRRKG